MSELKIVKLKDYISCLESGKREIGGAISSGIPSLGAEHLDDDGSFILSEKKLKYVSEEFFDKMEKGIIKPNDVIIVKDGATTGKVSYVDENFPFSKAAINEHVFLIRAKKSISSKYLFYYLFSDEGKSLVLNDFRGATVGGISRNFIDMPFPFINYELQVKIVSILDKANNLISLRKKQIEELDDLIQSVFYDMFGDPMYNNANWILANLKDLCVNILGGGTPSKSNPNYYVGDIPWVTPKDMKQTIINDSIDHINQIAIKESSTKLIPKGSILMVIRSGILKRTLPIAINNRPVTINQDMKAFILNDRINKWFLYYCIKFLENKLLSNVRAVTADNIEFSVITNLEIPVPPIILQEEFSNKVILIEQQKSLLQQSLEQLELNYKSLMQRAFNGTLFDE